MQRVSQLLSDNGGCRLPCWLGITPGVTTWAAAYADLRPFSQIISQGPYEVTTDGKRQVKSFHNVTFLLPNESQEGGFHATEVDGIVAMMLVGPKTASKAGLSLSSLLIDYGMPDQVFIDTTSHFPGEKPFDLLLYYAQQNIFADFEAWGRIEGDFICAVPQQSFPWIWLWADHSNYETDDPYPVWTGVGGEVRVPVPLEELTDLTLETFYAIYQDEHFADPLCVPIDRLPE